MKLFKVHFSSGAILVIIADSMTAAQIKAEYQADAIRSMTHRNIGYVVRVELNLDGEEV